MPVSINTRTALDREVYWSFLEDVCEEVCVLTLVPEPLGMAVKVGAKVKTAASERDKY